MKKILILIAMICNCIFANPTQLSDFIITEIARAKINNTKVSELVINKRSLFVLDLNLDNYKLTEKHGAFLLIIRF